MAETEDLNLAAMQKGSATLLVLALIEERARHGYEISTLIAERSGGRLQLQPASLYPLLYRLEAQELVAGRWVEKPGERRRRFYRLTPRGRRALEAHRRSWRELFLALDQVAQIGHA
ncbi:MAG TPA: helix-turn-helix transcriptional regulator [Thermoanaerobaculia bacterium]|jgi:DNA-binding PadR family transcriptional regulator|nr:helix-turn-helix transcriptional regulator [Thermoanaerobaculia bacterium]